MKTHELKTWPEFFEAVYNNRKPFEVRKNDRDFQVGDYLLLKEWDNDKKKYTGNKLTRQITYVLPGGQFGIENGFVVLGIEFVKKYPLNY